MEKYITKEEYRDAKGIDLDQELHKMDDPSNRSRRFIKNITDGCCEYLVQKYRAESLLSWRDSGDPTDPLLIEERQRYFREGVIEQIEYVLQNGAIHQECGFNPATGLVTDLSKVDLSRTAYRKFWLGGFCNI